MKRSLVAGLGLLMALVLVLPAVAAPPEKELKIEVTPYLWAVGIDGEITANRGPLKGEDADIDVGWDDISENLDSGGSLFVDVYYKNWIFWAEGDFLSVSDEDNNTPHGDVEVDIDTTLFAAGVGYRFPGFWGKMTIDVLVGARYLGMDTDVDIEALGNYDESTDIWDPIIVVRPSVPITDNLRFNPTISVGGGGDSDFLYELMPNFQYQFNDWLAGRIGYRKIYYDTSSDRADFEGSFSGLMVGIGATF